MNSRKIKIITVLWIVVFIGIDLLGIFYFLNATKPLDIEREMAISSGTGAYLDVLEAQKTQERNIFIKTGIIFMVAVLVFSGFFSFLAPRLREEWDSYSFKCKKCGYLFKPGSLEFSSLFSVNGIFYTVIYSVFKPPFFIKCPECKKRSWCKLEKINQPVI